MQIPFIWVFLFPFGMVLRPRSRIPTVGRSFFLPPAVCGYSSDVTVVRHIRKSSRTIEAVSSSMIRWFLSSGSFDTRGQTRGKLSFLALQKIRGMDFLEISFAVHPVQDILNGAISLLSRRVSIPSFMAI